VNPRNLLVRDAMVGGVLLSLVTRRARVVVTGGFLCLRFLVAYFELTTNDILAGLVGMILLFIGIDDLRHTVCAKRAKVVDDPGRTVNVDVVCRLVVGLRPDQGWL
jgi:predicted benzoate:H+ symporter BenE